MQANRLAEKFSRSVVNKFVTWSRAILEEAVDEDLLLKNPAKKLQMPETREVNKRFLTLKEIPVVLGKLPFREQTHLSDELGSGTAPRRTICSPLGRY